MNINNGYYDSDGNQGTSQVSHGGTCFDPYSHGESLSEIDVLVSNTRPALSSIRPKHTDFCAAS